MRRFSPSPMNPPAITRRRVLQGAAALGAWVQTAPASASSDELAAAVAGYTGGAAVQRGKVRLEIAELVDNGNVVPLTVTVDSAMTPAEHVRAIAIFNEKNPQREVAKFTLGPRAGKASVSTRMRLATSQQLVAVAHLSDGSFWSHSVNVIVTLAACIEGDT
ncbi:MAG: SoxY-related AACIE arm protein [Polaromonas sp.]|nr:SoxY-related AACIE arm protein [Polaromonas sp.]